MNLPNKKILNQDLSSETQEVILWDVIEIGNAKELTLQFISTNSQNRQGVWVCAEQGLKVNGISSPSFTIWSDTAPESTTIEIAEDAMLLHIYNIWDSGRGRSSQSYSSGMILSRDGDRLRYQCQDYGLECDFSKLVFEISLS